jgi:IPT/TIG domain
MSRFLPTRKRRLFINIGCLCFVLFAVVGLFFSNNIVTPVQSQATVTRETPTSLQVTLDKVELSVDARTYLELNSKPPQAPAFPSTIEVVKKGVSTFGTTNDNLSGELSFDQGTYKGLRLTIEGTGMYSGTDPCTGSPVTDQLIYLPGTIDSVTGKIVITYSTTDILFRNPNDLPLQAITLGSNPVEIRLVFLASNSVICSTNGPQLEKPLVLVTSVEPQNLAPQYSYSGSIDKSPLNPLSCPLTSATCTIGASVVLSGTSTGSNTSTTLNDTAQSFRLNQFLGLLVEITGGTDAGDVRTIIDNTATQLTVSQPWTITPDNTTQYQIRGENFNGYNFVWQINSFSPPLPFSNATLIANSLLTPPASWILTNNITGLSSGGNTLTTLNDTDQSFTAHQFINSLVQITSGTDANDVRTIVDNTDTQLTVSPTWTTIPDNTSTYQIFVQAGRLTLGCNSLPNGQGAPLVLLTMSPLTGCPPEPVPLISSPVPAANGNYVIPYQITQPASSQLSIINFVSTSLKESSSSSQESEFPRPQLVITVLNDGTNNYPIDQINWTYLTNPFLATQPKPLIVSQRMQMVANLPCDPSTDNTCSVNVLNGCYQPPGGLINAAKIYDSGPLNPNDSTSPPPLKNIVNTGCPINFSDIKTIQFSLTDALGTSFVFDFSLNPTVGSVSPTYGPVSRTVTINGVNFGASQGTSKVTFNGVDAGTATSWSDDQIVIHVPALATTGPVVVTVGLGVSNGVNFIVHPPIITSLSPASGPVGSSVTITGLRFGAAQGTSTVTFSNSTTGTAVTNYSSWSDTSITVQVPVGAPTGTVVVIVGGMPSNGAAFTVQ